MNSLSPSVCRRFKAAEAAGKITNASGVARQWFSRMRVRPGASGHAEWSAAPTVEFPVRAAAAGRCLMVVIAAKHKRPSLRRVIGSAETQVHDAVMIHVQL